MNELLESRFEFEKITYTQVKELLDLISDSQRHNRDYLKKRFERITQNFEDTAAFLEDLGFVRTVEGSLEANIQQPDLSDEKLKYTLVEALFHSSKRSIFQFHEYIENFVEIDGTYSYRPVLSTNLQTSGLRNLLMQMAFIRYDKDTGVYSVNESWNTFLKGRRKVLSARGLAAILRSQEQLGTRAEELILTYEKDTLASLPELASLVKHVAREDVSAGYDIYSVRPLKGDGFEDRFIEVKAVSTEMDFYWSRNEINAAKTHGSKYYLYLVPVNRGGLKIGL